MKSQYNTSECFEYQSMSRLGHVVVIVLATGPTGREFEPSQGD
jgi:hypothetical protein